MKPVDTNIDFLFKECNGYPQVEFFDIHILPITTRIKNLNISKLSSIIYQVSSIHYLTIIYYSIKKIK
jgi:hypothetical protein